MTACGTAHSHTRELAYFDSVWEGGCGLHAKSVCCPTAHPHTRGLILSASDGIRNMLFSTHSHTSHLLHCCFHSVLRLGNCLLCHGSGEVFVVPLVLNSLTMCAAVSEEAASDILVGAQPRIRCWTRARSSSSELVDTATARRRQREEDATRVGLQFPFRSERRGRGAPSVAMKWRDAVKAAIMHGPLPPDVTLDAPHWWQPGMPLLPPADYVAPVPLKRKRDTSAEPKTEHAKRAYVRTPDEAKLWFAGLPCLSSACPRQVARLQHSPGEAAGAGALRARGARHIPQMARQAAHVTLAADRPWSYHHLPFRVSRTSHMPSRPGSASASPLGSTSTAVCCASSTSNSSPERNGRGSSYAACSSHGNSRRLARATGRARLTLPESVNFCSCASSTCAIASKSHRIASGTWTRQLCASFQQASAGGARGPNQPMSSPRAPSSRSRLLQT